ncbi:DUF1294 domain-containing protein [Achromobacter insuavis]|nr:DUF1294 domain-containing protein [Achromobacter insuavis]
MHTALILLACLAAYGLATYLLQVPLWVGLAYLSLSLITIAFYTWDKAQARAGQWRISERTLHGLALAGGWPGALLAQRWLRHKTIKRSFRIQFWATVALNLAAFVVLSPVAQAWWRP